MMADELHLRYRAALVNLRSQVMVRLDKLYADTIDLADIDASFARYIPQAALIVRAGQANGVSLTNAYVRALVAISG